MKGLVAIQIRLKIRDYNQKFIELDIDDGSNNGRLSLKNRHQPVIYPLVLERDFDGKMPFHTNQFGLGKRHWNLETSSAVVEFPPPYQQNFILIICK